MNSQNFKNYEEFKELFVRENGERKNRILLAALKSKEFRNYLRKANLERKFLNVKSMPDLYIFCKRAISDLQRWTPDRRYVMSFLGKSYYTSNYEISNGGVCFDGDTKAIRYRNVERGAIFKMKIGKMYKHIALSTDFGRALPEPVLLYLCEEVTREWEAFTSAKTDALSDLHLVVDNDFKYIYSSRNYADTIYSCMTDDGLHTFYENAVSAKAASLRDPEDQIVARCVIFTKVHDCDTGEVLRLAERQYSVRDEPIYKSKLVDELIKGGHIDGYKKIGAGCGEAKAFLTNSGESMSNRSLYIDCDLELDDPLSYQDSFKWYDIDLHEAYNTEDGALYGLDITEGSLEDSERNWDSYHERYTNNELVTVYVNGHEYTCDEDDLDDFCYVSLRGLDEYHHTDDCRYSEYHQEWYHEEECCYSELFDDYFPDVDNMAEAEEEYKSENWYFSDWDGEYYENKEDLNVIHQWNCGEWSPITIYHKTLSILIESGEAICEDGEYYVAKDYYEYIGLPVTTEAQGQGVCA